MANFWDLPKVVREQIYRLHLVREGTTSVDDFNADVRCSRDNYERYMPAICRISQKAEKESAPIYFGENHFEFGDGKPKKPTLRALGTPHAFGWRIYTRHLRLIRKVTYQWPFGFGATSAREAFMIIARMKGLQELYIRVDEVVMIRHMLDKRHTRQNWYCKDPTPQQQLAILRHPGMTGILTISRVPHVSFIKARSYNGDEEGGPISGGVLETQVLPKLMRPKPAFVQQHDDTLPFLKLPGELRNRIYSFLLEINGPVHPSIKPPSSTPKGNATRKTTPPAIESALNILAVNRQIHDEAVAIFYHANEFEFYYPTQLQAFLMSLGTQRKSFIRKITLHYYNQKCGGIDLADLTFPMLRQLSGLRQLHILFLEGLTKRMHRRWSWNSRLSWKLYGANPMTLPGIKTLFTLRDVEDIQVRDTELEEQMKIFKNDKNFPKFEHATKEWAYVEMTRILEHINAALSDAQTGKVNKKLLEDDEWHLKEVFATIDEEIEDMAPVDEGSPDL